MRAATPKPRADAPVPRAKAVSNNAAGAGKPVAAASLAVAVQPGAKAGTRVKQYVPKVSTGLLSGRAQVDTPEFKAWFGQSKVRDSQGEVRVVLHGTTASFTAFLPEKMNPECFLGCGYYFTTSPEDANTNYAGVGPDLADKIIRLSEHRAGEEDRAYDDPEIKAEVRASFVEHEGVVIPVYLRLENPLFLDGPGETFLDYESGWDPDDEDTETEPSGQLVDFLAALREKVKEHYCSADDGISKAEAMAYEDGGIKVSTLIELIKTDENMADAYAEAYPGASMACEVIRQAFEEIGFDGAILTNVEGEFGTKRKYGTGMAGIDAQTIHYMAFRPDQMKSALGNCGTFDAANADLVA